MHTLRAVGLLGWIFLGLFAATIARALVPGRPGPEGCIGTTAVGILGALLGGWLATELDLGRLDEFFDLETWLIAIGGSVVLLLFFSLLGGGTRRR